MTTKSQKQPTVEHYQSNDSGKLPPLFFPPSKLLPPPQKNMGGNNIESIESIEYSSGVSMGVYRSNNEVRHSLDSTLVRGLVNQGVVGSGQFSTYYLYFCRNRATCVCQFRMIERRDQYSGSSVFSILENHSVDCIQSETRTRKGEISDAEFFNKDTLEVNSDKGNRGGMIILHKGKIHRNKGKSSSEYRRFFCKEKDCSHRIIERKNDGMVCIRGYHECLTEKSPKKATVKFYTKDEMCVSVTNGHLKGGKPAKNLIANGCLFLSNRKNVLLGGRKFEENTLANEYICQIKNQFKRNRNRDRNDFHCNAIIKERISDGNIILQGHHDPKCLHYSKKFYTPDVHVITVDENENMLVRGIRFSPLSTRSMKFGKEEISVMEYMCACKASYTHIGCNAVLFKHLEQDTYFLTGRHDEFCMRQKNLGGGPSLPVLPNLRIIGPPLIPPPPPSDNNNNLPMPMPMPQLSMQGYSPMMSYPKNPVMPPPPPPPSSGRQTLNSRRRSLVNNNNHHHQQQQQQQQQQTNNNNGFGENQKYLAIDPATPINPIPELRILSVYPGIVDRPGSTINLLLRCPRNFSHLIRPNLFTVYFSESNHNNNNNQKTEVIPRSSFYFPSIQFSDEIGNEWGVGQATCRIVVTLPFFFGLTGLLNLYLDLPSNIHLEMKNALMVSPSNVDRRQNELESAARTGKKRKLVDLIIPQHEKRGEVARNGGSLPNLVLGRESRIVQFFPDKPQSPKVPYAEIFLHLQPEEKEEEIEVFFNHDRANVLGGFDHKFGGRMTRFCKMYKSKYEETCQEANFLLTVEVPDFFIASAIDLAVVIGKKRTLVTKNVFQVNHEEVRRDPFLLAINNNGTGPLGQDILGVQGGRGRGQDEEEVGQVQDADERSHVVNHLVDEMFNRPETPPGKVKYDGLLFSAGAGFNRVESLDELDQMGEL